MNVDHASKRSGDLILISKSAESSEHGDAVHQGKFSPHGTVLGRKKRLSSFRKGHSRLRTIDVQVSSPKRGFGPYDSRYTAHGTVHFGGYQLIKHSLYYGFDVSQPQIDRSFPFRHELPHPRWGSFKRTQPNFVNFSSAWCLSPTNSKVSASCATSAVALE